jgi:FkbM family methyltransferase
MELDPTDFMDQQFFLGTCAPELDFIIQHWVRSGDTCIDIGAQKGFVTLSLASRVGNDGWVPAFEPDRRARERLVRNCAHDRVSCVQLFEYAVGSQEGIQSFYLSSQLGWSSAYPNAIADPTICSVSKVPVRSMDGLVSGVRSRLTRMGCP